MKRLYIRKNLRRKQVIIFDHGGYVRFVSSNERKAEKIQALGEIKVTSYRIFFFFDTSFVLFFFLSSSNLVPRSHSVTGNVRSGKVRQYTIFHWLLKKGCGNAIYAPIGLLRGALSEGLVFASSCAVLKKCQLCGGNFCFIPTPGKLYS